MLSPLQIKILQNLVVFKQLTIPQFARLNNSSSEQSIRRALIKLYKRRRPLVNRVEFKKVSHFGKLSYVHNLTILGVKALENQTNQNTTERTFTPATPRLTDDYFHRVTTIDFQIFMYTQSQEEAFELVRSDHYFLVEKVLKTFQPINKIGLGKGMSIVPDLIALLSQEGRYRWVMFELHNGLDKNRIKDQIKQHALCLTGLFAHRKYKIEEFRSYYILLVFESEGVMKAVLKDLSNDIWYSKVGQFFLCKPLVRQGDSFLRGWTNLLGEPSKINI